MEKKLLKKKKNNQFGVCSSGEGLSIMEDEVVAMQISDISVYGPVTYAKCEEWLQNQHKK